MSKNREKEHHEKIDISDCECPQDTARTRDQVTYRVNHRRKNEKSVNGVNHTTSSDKFPRNGSSSPVVKVTSAEGIKSWSRKDCGGRKREKSIRDSSSNISTSPSPRKGPSQYPSRSKLPHTPCNCCQCKNLQKNSKSPFNSPRTSGISGIYSQSHQKLCKLLKTKEARRIIGCTCDNESSQKNCSVDCSCPESPASFLDSAKNTGINDSNCKSEVCSCHNFSEDYASTAINMQDLQPEVPPPADWRKCGEYLKKFSKEYRELSAHLKSLRRTIEAGKRNDTSFHKKITRKYPNKEFSFEVRSIDRKNCDNQPENTENGSFFVEETIETVDRSCQATNSTKSFSKSRGNKVLHTQCECRSDFYSIGAEGRGKSLPPRGRSCDFKRENSRGQFDEIFPRRTKNSIKQPFRCENASCNRNVRSKRTGTSNFSDECPDFCENEGFDEKSKKFNFSRKDDKYFCNQRNHSKKAGNSHFSEENEDFWNEPTKCDEKKIGKSKKSNFFEDCENCCREKPNIHRKNKNSYFSGRNEKNNKNPDFLGNDRSCWESKPEFDNKNHKKAIFCCDETNCEAKIEEYSSDPVKYSSNTRKSRRKTRKSRKEEGKKQRHDFSLPRIVHTSRTRKNDDKMLIYPPEDQVGSPVSLYKTESFVNFCLEEVDDLGYQYDVTYIQKYRSSPWQPEKTTEDEVNSGYFSSDDYG